MMEDGTFTYYTLQHRVTHKSPWLEPEGELSPVVIEEWHFSSWDHFGWVAEPWTGAGNNCKPKYKKAHNETYDVWANTGSHGWWSLKYAVRGLKRVREASANGKFDSKDGYNNICQAVRYEFRLVKLTVSKCTEPVREADYEDALETIK